MRSFPQDHLLSQRRTRIPRLEAPLMAAILADCDRYMLEAGFPGLLSFADQEPKPARHQNQKPTSQRPETAHVASSGFSACLFRRYRDILASASLTNHSPYPFLYHDSVDNRSLTGCIIPVTPPKRRFVRI